MISINSIVPTIEIISLLEIFPPHTLMIFILDIAEYSFWNSKWI